MAGSGRRVASQVQPAQQPEEIAPPREVRELRKTFEDPQSRVREEVLAERGLTKADLLRLGGQARLEAEIAIRTEVARRTGPQRLLDLRV
jgi:hypothetical protein